MPRTAKPKPPKEPKPKKKSSNYPLEEKFASEIMAKHFPDVVYVTQYIIPPKRFIYDVAIPHLKVVIELQGGIWKGGKGGHSSGTGINRDCNKSNHALISGWRLVKLTTNHVRDKPLETVELLRKVFYGER